MTMFRPPRSRLSGNNRPWSPGQFPAQPVNPAGPPVAPQPVSIVNAQPQRQPERRSTNAQLSSTTPTPPSPPRAVDISAAQNQVDSAVTGAANQNGMRAVDISRAVAARDQAVQDAANNQYQYYSSKDIGPNGQPTHSWREPTGLDLDAIANDPNNPLTAEFTAMVNQMRDNRVNGGPWPPPSFAVWMAQRQAAEQHDPGRTPNIFDVVREQNTNQDPVLADILSRVGLGKELSMDDVLKARQAGNLDLATSIMDYIVGRGWNYAGSGAPPPPRQGENPGMVPPVMQWAGQLDQTMNDPNSMYYRPQAPEMPAIQPPPAMPGAEGAQRRVADVDYGQTVSRRPRYTVRGSTGRDGIYTG